MRQATRLLLTAWLGLVIGSPGLGLAQTRPAAGAATAPPASASALAYEQQLQAIRQALIDATLQTPTQVFASSWIDNMGALRESHQFNSKAEVRSVRLLPQDPNQTQDSGPRAAADVLPWGWRSDPRAQNTCSPAPRMWRAPLLLSAQRAPGFPGPQAAASQSMLQAVMGQVQQALGQGSRWSPRERPVLERNSYLRTLASPPRDEAAGWRLDIRLEPEGPNPTSTAIELPVVAESSTTPRWASTPVWTWVLRMQLAQTQNDQTITTSWQQEFRIGVDAQQLADHPGQWRAPIEAALGARVRQWLGGIERLLQCEPVQFVVRSREGGVLQLMADSNSGLRPGDRVLIMQPGWVPSRVLDPRAADHLALAEVVRLSSGHTDIRQLAGPPLPIGSDWVALPL